MVDVLKSSTGEVGYILAIYTLSALFIRLITGFALDTYGRKLIYLISFAAFAVLLGFYTLAYSFVLLMALRFFHGFTWGASTTAASTLVIDISPPQRRGEAIGIYGLSFTFAMAIAPVIALTIMGKDNYNGMFLTATGLAVAGFLLILLVQFPKYDKPKTRKPFTFSNMIAPASLPMALIQLLFGLTYGGVMSFITLYALEKEIDDVGIFFTVFAVGIAASRIISGKVFDHHGPKILVLTGLLSGGAGFMVLGMMANLTGFMISALLIGVCMGVTMPTLQAMANNVVDRTKRGAANATFITAFDIGIGGGSMILGFVAHWTSLSTMYILSAAVIGCAVLVYVLYTHRFYIRHKITEIVFNPTDQ